MRRNLRFLNTHYSRVDIKESPLVRNIVLTIASQKFAKKEADVKGQMSKEEADVNGQMFTMIHNELPKINEGAGGSQKTNTEVSTTESEPKALNVASSYQKPVIFAPGFLEALKKGPQPDTTKQVLSKLNQSLAEAREKRGEAIQKQDKNPNHFFNNQSK
jgi:hypothetical protein